VYNKSIPTYTRKVIDLIPVLVCRAQVAQWVWLPNNSYTPISNTTTWVCARFVNNKKGALDSQSQVIQFTSCLPMVGGSLRHFQQYFSYIMATSFSGGRSRSTRREPPTMGKQLVNCITCDCESNAPFFVIYKSGTITFLVYVGIDLLYTAFLLIYKMTL
jgi:hypothetical protein